MPVIRTQTDIDATVDAVWNIISDIDSEPRFWKGTKQARRISEKDGTITREVTLAFRDQKCIQEVEITPKRAVHAVFTQGILSGTKTMTIEPIESGTMLVVLWDIRLTGVMKLFQGAISGHVEKGTRQAVQAIKEAAEKC